jgi:hypothetical protein
MPNRTTRGLELGSEAGYARIRAAFNDKYPDAVPHVSRVWSVLEWHADALNAWELQFLRSIVHVKRPSVKQSAAIERILAKTAGLKPSRAVNRRKGAAR